MRPTRAAHKSCSQGRAVVGKVRRGFEKNKKGNTRGSNGGTFAPQAGVATEKILKKTITTKNEVAELLDHI